MPYQYKAKEIKAEKRSIDELDFDAQERMVRFFELLLKIDRRNNPEIYD